MKAQSYLRLSDLQEDLKKQYDVVFDRLQSYYKLLKEVGITWKKTQKINPPKNEELVEAKKVREKLLVKWQFINRSWKACSVYG
jgi:putative transposase